MKRIPMYEFSRIAESASHNAIVFRKLKDDPKKGLLVIEKFRERVEKILENFDREMIVLCKDDVYELTDWANRIRSIRTRLDEMDRQLAVKGTRLFDWETTTQAMGYVDAHRVAIEQVISCNEEPIATK